MKPETKNLKQRLIEALEQFSTSGFAGSTRQNSQPTPAIREVL